MVSRASKKSTVEELRGSLAAMGLDTKGKKETLWRRLYHFIRRPAPTEDSHPAGGDDVSAEVVDDDDGNAQTALSLSLEPSNGGPSARKWGKQPCRSFLCFDVEATCRGGKEFDWPNEIIEFPVVLLQWAEDHEVLPEVEGEGVVCEGQHTGSAPESGAGPSTPSIARPRSAKTDAAPEPAQRLIIVDTFQSYVRPVWQPKLSTFCTEFTGITQDMVDAAPTFPEMLKLFEAWLDGHGLRVNYDGDTVEGIVDAMWVTDGPWDLRDFLRTRDQLTTQIPKQLHITPCDPAYPLYLRQPYLNIKQAFQTVLSEEYRREQYLLAHPGQPPNERALSRITTGKLVGRDNQDRCKGLGFYGDIPSMLKKLELGEFEGRRHCGLDDATNVARILQVLAEKDVLFEANARLPPPKNKKKWPWMGQPGEVNWEEWMSDAKGLQGNRFEPSKASAAGDVDVAHGSHLAVEGTLGSTNNQRGLSEGQLNNSREEQPTERPGSSELAHQGKGTVEPTKGEAV